MSNILVTGGSGFIGSNLVKELIAKGHNVSIIDIKDSINSECQHYKYNICHDRFLEDFDERYDFIFHMAAWISIPESIVNPNKYFENVSGTFNILKFAERTGVKRVIFSSSASVYGNAKPPHFESMATKCFNMYAQSKLSGENLMEMWSKLYKTDTVSLRYFNIFGPGQDECSPYAAVIPKFIQKIINNEVITVFGDGEQKRDFIYINDVINANINSMLNERINGEVINIASGKSISINELIKLLETVSGKKAKITYTNRRDGDVLESEANNSKMKNILGINVSDLLDSLHKTYNWYLQRSELR